MNFLLGLDPGGIGNFGWCITRDSGMCQCHETTLDLNLVSFRFSQRAR
jgi:hypothetical protein